MQLKTGLNIPVKRKVPVQESKYISSLLAKAEQRKREHEIIKEKNRIEELEGPVTERFVTSAYKEEIQKRQKLIAEQENEQDNMKKRDVGAFAANVLERLNEPQTEQKTTVMEINTRAQVEKTQMDTTTNLRQIDADHKTSIDNKLIGAAKYENKKPTAELSENEIKQLRRERIDTARERYFVRNPKAREIYIEQMQRRKQMVV